MVPTLVYGEETWGMRKWLRSKVVTKKMSEVYPWSDLVGQSNKLGEDGAELVWGKI